MSAIQEAQNKRLIDYATQHFNSTTHEYGRADMAGQRASRHSNERIDASRFNQDLDGDGRKGVDCSSMVYYSLQGSGFDVQKTAANFTTTTLFEGRHVTDYAKSHFDVLPPSSKTDHSLKPGDLLMMKMPNGSQHVAIFKEYDDKGRIHFFGSQTSTGPAEVTMTGNRYWDDQTVFLGALRPKEEFMKPEFRQHSPDPEHTATARSETKPAAHTPEPAYAKTSHQIVPDETLRENQQMLIALGAKIKDDGLYGPKTEHALKGYQAFKGLKEDGQFNAETMAALKADMQKQGLAKDAPAQKPESEQLPKEVKARLDNAEKQVRELFTREGLNYDKQYGERFTLAAAQLGAEKGINPIEFIGVDRTSGHMIIGNKENGLLNTASMLTADVGKVDPQMAINTVQHSVQEQNQAQQQQKQEQTQQAQEHYQHKGAQR